MIILDTSYIFAFYLVDLMKCIPYPDLFPNMPLCFLFKPIFCHTKVLLRSKCQFALLCTPVDANEWIVFGTNTQMFLSSQLFKHHLFKLYIAGHVWWMWTLLSCTINTQCTVWITDIKWIVRVINSICNLIWQYHSYFMVMMILMEDSRTVSNHSAHDTTQLNYSAFLVGLGLP